MTVQTTNMTEKAKEFLEAKELEFKIVEEKYSNHIYVETGSYKASIQIYSSGKIVIEGSESPLRFVLENLKDNLERGVLKPEDTLPYEIERFPEIIKERIKDCDPIIISFIEEAIKALKSELLLATSFLVGAASEKAIHIMIDTYCESIENQTNRERFKQRVGKKRVISANYEEFKQSYKSCKNPCEDIFLSHDLETILDSMFTFYRTTRNVVGHPQVAPNLDKGILTANMAQFVTYLEKIYALINYFQTNPIKL